MRKHKTLGIHGPDRYEKKNGPLRTCVGCGSVRAKEALIRLVVGAEGQARVDVKQVERGRGAYLCGAACLASAVKRKALHRAFRNRLKSLDLTSLELALSQ